MNDLKAYCCLYVEEGLPAVCQPVYSGKQPGCWRTNEWRQRLQRWAALSLHCPEQPLRTRCCYRWMQHCCYPAKNGHKVYCLNICCFAIGDSAKHSQTSFSSVVCKGTNEAAKMFRCYRIKWSSWRTGYTVVYSWGMGSLLRTVGSEPCCMIRPN